MGIKKNIELGKSIKIIGQNEAGNLTFLAKNFKAVIKHAASYAAYKPVSFVTCTGGQTDQNLYFTRLVEKRIIESHKKWLEFKINQNQFQPYFLFTKPEVCSKNNENGVYLWPSILSMSQNSNPILVFILHVYTNNGSPDDLLEFAKLLGTCIVNISSDEQVNPC